MGEATVVMAVIVFAYVSSPAWKDKMLRVWYDLRRAAIRAVRFYRHLRYHRQIGLVAKESGLSIRQIWQVIDPMVESGSIPLQQAIYSVRYTDLLRETASHSSTQPTPTG